MMHVIEVEVPTDRLPPADGVEAKVTLPRAMRRSKTGSGAGRTSGLGKRRKRPSAGSRCSGRPASRTWPTRSGAPRDWTDSMPS